MADAASTAPRVPPPPPPADDRKSGSGNAIKGWLKSTVSSLDENLSQIREGAHLAAQELPWGAKAAKVEYEEQRMNLIFIEKPLGLELDISRGCVVRAVKPGGQGERLQAQADDRLVAIANQDLPAFVPGQEYIEEVQGRMRTMGRPVTLTFVRMVEVVPPPEETEKTSDKVMDTVKKGLMGRDRGDRSGQGGQELQAELEAAKEDARRYKAEAAEAREEAKLAADDAIVAVEEAAALRADLADLQLSKVWALEEKNRERAEADVARVEAQQARDALAARSQELLRLQEAAGSSERASAAALQACTAQREEAERVQARLDQALAEAEELRRAHASTQQELEAARSQTADISASSAQEVKRFEIHLADSIASLKEAERLQAEGEEAIQAAREQEAASKREVESLGSELAALQADKQRLDASDKLIPELRREVERLRKEGERSRRELGLYESASGGAVVPEADAEEARRRVEELEAEVERLRAAVRETSERQEEAAGAVEGTVGQCGWDEAFGESLGEAASSDAPEGMDAPEERAAHSVFAIISPADALKALEVRIAELEHANAALTRQLNARPIVFQFGPSMDEVEGEMEAGLQEQEEEEDPEVQLAAFAAAAVPHMRSVMGSKQASRGAEPTGVVRAALLFVGALLWLRRQLVRGFKGFRKQRQTKYLEKLLRYFTKSLLNRPVLLWLWYVHVLVLWCMVTSWHAAVTQSLSTDPSHHINQVLQEHAKLAPKESDHLHHQESDHLHQESAMAASAGAADASVSAASAAVAPVAEVLTTTFVVARSAPAAVAAPPPEPAADLRESVVTAFAGAAAASASAVSAAAAPALVEVLTTTLAAALSTFAPTTASTTLAAELSTPAPTAAPPVLL